MFIPKAKAREARDKRLGLLARKGLYGYTKGWMESFTECRLQKP